MTAPWSPCAEIARPDPSPSGPGGTRRSAFRGSGTRPTPADGGGSESGTRHPARCRRPRAARGRPAVLGSEPGITRTRLCGRRDGSDPSPPPDPAPLSTDSAYEYRAPVRYLEADQQGVVFNMWYLAYFDEAMTGFLDANDLSYAVLQAGGHDVQVVHTELDWRGALHWGDTARVRVQPESVGRTSFTLAFEVRAEAEEVLVTGRTVYVCIRMDGTGKTPIPDDLRAVLSRSG